MISNWPRASRSSDLEISRAMTPRIVLHSVQLLPGTQQQDIEVYFCFQLEGMELKLQHFHTDLADKTQWMNDTETLLKSPAFNLDDENITSDKVAQQNELVEVTLQFCRIL